jgi:hypothetical protein
MCLSLLHVTNTVNSVLDYYLYFAFVASAVTLTRVNVHYVLLLRVVLFRYSFYLLCVPCDLLCSSVCSGRLKIWSNVSGMLYLRNSNASWAWRPRLQVRLDEPFWATTVQRTSSSQRMFSLIWILASSF